MRLLIVIPALDEEESIASVIERTLAAEAEIASRSPVTEVSVAVVSDGSTDRTVERARAFGTRIELIEFPVNRGYGAAIQEAWSRSEAEVLGFLDADGTCDPRWFGELCRALFESGADVVAGSRMGPGTRMPRLRRLGNRLFAVLLSWFSRTRVLDAASGMRVVRRSSLPRLLPLPAGLHFTPAMTARAALSGDLSIAEVPMPYEERQGRSKLSPLRDGLRFLAVILETALLYRPARLLGGSGVLLGLVGAVLMANPIRHYLEHREVLEWMIYRFVVASLAGTSGALCLATSFMCQRMVGLTISPRAPEDARRGTKVWSGPAFWLAPATLAAVGAALVWSSFRELVTTGATYEHWSRFLVMSFLFSLAAILIVTRVASHGLDLVAERIAYLDGAEGRERLRREP